MANIVREDQEKLTTQITINLEKEDYQPKVDAELKKLRKKVNLKGFRSGKVPVSYVKKIYGKQVLAEQINTVLSDQLNGYLTDNKLNILGQPLPIEDEVPNLDEDNLDELTFKYEIGLAPEFELQGLDDKTSVSKHAVEVDDDRLQEELDKILKQHGQHTHPETIDETDMVNFNAEELDFAPKAEPFTKDMSFAMDLIPTKTLRKQFLGKGKGDTIEVKDIFKMEKRDEKDFRKFILGVEEETPINKAFKLTVTNIHRNAPAEMNQELFDKVLGPDQASTEEEFKAKIKEFIEKSYENQAEGKLYGTFQEKLMDLHTLEFPEPFLKKWLIATNEEMDEEKVEADFENFTKGLTWSLILGKLAEKFELEVTQEELINSFRANIQQYFQGYADEATVNQFVERMLQDQNTVNRRAEELMSGKALKAALETVKIEDESIHWKAFDELLQAQ